MSSTSPEVGGEQVFALVSVGDLQVGLPVEHVVHALPWPQALARLPRVRGALAGVFNYRELTVPLISLRQWLQLPEQEQEPGQVMVLKVGSRVLGLGVDAIQGLLQVPADQVVAVHHDDQPEELFHSVAIQPGTGTPVSLLDPLRLMRQAAVWCETDIPGQSEMPTPVGRGEDTGPVDPGAPSQAWAVVRTGSIIMACRAQDVGEVVAMPSLQKVFGSASSLLGIARWRERDLPVARILELLGLGAEQLDTTAWMLVLGDQGRYIGIPVDEVRAVRTFEPAQVQAGTHAGLAHPGLFEGLVATEAGEPHLLLNTQAVIERCPLHEISAPRAAPGAATANGRVDDVQQGDEASQAHVVFRAGHAFATVLQGMQEIMLYPAGALHPREGNEALLGTFDWRGKACALWDLRALAGLGRSDITPSSRVMVAQLRGRIVGLLVDELLALLPAHQGEHTRFSFGPNLDIHMISVGQGDSRQSYRVLDLNTLPGLNPPGISS